MTIEDVLTPTAFDGRWRFICHTCRADPESYDHEALTRSRGFAHLCRAEHARRGHDAEVLRVG